LFVPKAIGGDMKKQNTILTFLSIIIVVILFALFQYVILLKKQNNLLMASVDSVKKQIVFFESRNNVERWHSRIAELAGENKELKSKIAILEAILAQEAEKSNPDKAQESPKKNKGFLFKKR
jgi:hypothetical protein